MSINPLPGLKRIACVVGARPNLMKIAPILEAIHRDTSFQPILVHTGQHYDINMNDQNADALGLPAPDVNLEVGSGSHAVQTAEVMRRFEPVLDNLRPSAVLVVGDVNSTLACALVAAKKGVPVIHVEAGLRSYDRTMPEEINRVLTDQISELLLTSEKGAYANLIREGIDPDRIHFVGNVMIDSLRKNLARAMPVGATLSRMSSAIDVPTTRGSFGVVTLHRPSNVDDPHILKSLLNTFCAISAELPLIFPVHPRTREQIRKYCFESLLESSKIALITPTGYLEMLGLMKDARVVLTDSGGIQEETTALGVPCITLRENTERPITVDEGTNVVTGIDPEAVFRAFRDVMLHGGKAGLIPEYWDGRAAERIAKVIAKWLPSDTSISKVA